MGCFEGILQDVIVLEDFTCLSVCPSWSNSTVQHEWLEKFHFHQLPALLKHITVQILELFFFFWYRVYCTSLTSLLSLFVSLSLSSRSLARPHPNRQLRSPLWSLHSLRYQTFFFKHPFRLLLPQCLSLDKPKHLSTPRVQLLSHWPRYYLKYV